MSNDQSINTHPDPWQKLYDEKVAEGTRIAELIGLYGARARFENNALCAELVSKLRDAIGIGGAQ